MNTLFIIAITLGVIATLGVIVVAWEIVGWGVRLVKKHRKKIRT